MTENSANNINATNLILVLRTIKCYENYAIL